MLASKSALVCVCVWVCVCVGVCVCKRLDMTNVHEQGVPGLLFMLGTMSSRRVNVPAKRSTWVAESAAGILNGDRTHIIHIPVTCYMLLSALHFADSSICHSLCLARRRRGGTGH